MTVAFLFFCSFVRAEEAPIPATPTQWVTDTVGFLPTDAQQSLNKRLEQYEKTAGRKVAIWIGTTTGDAALETWTSGAVNAWKVRDKGYGDGVVLFILTQDRAIDVEVPAGLEKILPDDFVGQLIMDQMAPRLDRGDTQGALTAALDTLLPRLDQSKANPAPQTPAKVSPSASVESLKSPISAPVEQTPDSEKKPAASPPPMHKSNALLFVAFGLLVLLSIVGITAIGWSAARKKTM